MVGFDDGNSNVTLMAVVQKGYKFIGWYIDDSLYNVNSNLVLEIGDIKGKVIVACFEKINYSNDVIIAENVIIGNIPQTYYNIQGIENLDKSDTLNMLQE